MPATDAINRGEVAEPGLIARVRYWGARLGPSLATSLVPFLLIVYAGLKGGGYDAIIRGEVGIAVWWIVLLGALVGAFPLARMPVCES